MLATGAGQISTVIARRVGFGKKIILGGKKKENAEGNTFRIFNPQNQAFMRSQDYRFRFGSCPIEEETDICGAQYIPKRIN